MELLDNMDALFLIFWETSILFSIAAVSIYSLQDSISPHPFPHVIVNFFDNSHFKRCKVISHCDFEFSFPWGLMLSIFLCACWPSVFILWRNAYLDHLPIFWLGYLFIFNIALYQLFVYFGYESLVGHTRQMGSLKLWRFGHLSGPVFRVISLVPSFGTFFAGGCMGLSLPSI